MGRVMSVCFGVLVYLLLLPAPTAAQGTSAATITGVVKDTSGAVLPGVTVEAASPALIEKVRSTVTDDKGVFRITELRPGTYTVTFSLPGFSTLKRDGLELTSNFTAAIQGVLKVGGLEETITVSGESPLVDVQTVVQQTVLQKALLDAVPTNRSVASLAALMPMVVLPPSASDVGGSGGEAAQRISIHGSKFSDQKLLQDGMRVTPLSESGGSRGHIVNTLAAQEVVVETGGGGSAEVSTAGAVMNMIPKDGGNRFSGSFFATGSNRAMQGTNLTDKLRAQGLNSVNSLPAVFDVNGYVAGPLVQDRLWFMTDSRRWGRTQAVPDLYEDARYDDWVFTPDLNKPVTAPERNRQHDVRVTWQASTKDKVSAAYGWQYYHGSNNRGKLSTTDTAWERKGNSYCPTTSLKQVSWVRPQSNRLLFEGGFTKFNFRINTLGKVPDNCDTLPAYAAITEQNLAFSPATWHGSGSRGDTDDRQENARASMSYVSGAHHFKTGMFMEHASSRSSSITTSTDTRGLPLSYTFNSGVPVQLSQSVSPSNSQRFMNPEFALFAQDQWTVKRLTLNLGLRFEYMRQSAPAIDLPVGLLSDARHFDPLSCIPCWKDINPRVAVAYDLFGDGKTAVKASIGRYVKASTTEIAGAYAPQAAAITSTTRAWTDSNGNFFPDCDLRSTVANGECGAMANPSFGGIQPRVHADPDWITGWGKRGYAWTSGVSIQRELGLGVALDAGYYRSWYGNQTVRDNILVTPADYDPYCVTAPVDARLGSVSGRQVCGLYDIKPEKFGQVDSVDTLASKFGKYTEVFNGVDISLNARLPRGANVSGGVSLGNSVGTGSGFEASVGSGTKRCFVVDSPQDLYNCESANPYRPNFKVNGSIPLPRGFQAAAVYTNLPALGYFAAATFSTAQIQPSLGRPLAGGTRNVTIDLLQPTSAFLDSRTNQLDLRLSKKWRAAGLGFQLNTDLYNVFDASPVLNINSTYGTNGANWLRPTQVLDARLFKMGVQVDF